jgi:hypothetical protein
VLAGDFSQTIVPAVRHPRKADVLGEKGAQRNLQAHLHVHAGRLQEHEPPNNRQQNPALGNQSRYGFLFEGIEEVGVPAGQTQHHQHFTSRDSDDGDDQPDSRPPGWRSENAAQ